MTAPTERPRVPSLSELTPEQLEVLTAIREKWFKLGTSTEPANRQLAEEGVRRAYHDAGLKQPQHIIWVDSPYAAAMALGLIPAAIDAAMETVRQAVKDNVEAPTGTVITKRYEGTYRADPVAIQDWWRSSTYGNHSSGYFGYLEAMNELGLGQLDKMAGPLQVAENAGWWWPTEDYVIITERPSELHLDQNNQLHHAEGPALAYPDGWAVWAWHGTQVPKELILGKWTADDILKHDNTEVRRCAIEHRGWDRFIAEANLKRVGKEQEDPGNPGHFLSIYSIPRRLYGEPVYVLLCDNATPERDGTRRRFGLTVDTNVRDAVEAAAWTFGLTREEYVTMNRAT